MHITSQSPKHIVDNHIDTAAKSITAISTKLHNEDVFAQHWY